MIKIDEVQIQYHIGSAVRSKVKETMNGLLDAEAGRVCAGRFVRSAQRRDTRAGHYERSLHTCAGEVKLKVPELRKLPLETAIIERCRRREASVKESLMEMYFAGVSVWRIEDIAEALWGTRVSAGAVSRRRRRLPALSSGSV